MASTLNIVLCALAATLLWVAIGLPLARRLLPPPLALPMAAALGWAVHSALALPLLSLAGMSRVTVFIVVAVPFVAAIAILFRDPPPPDDGEGARVPVSAYAAAAVLACAVAVAILPKISGDSVALAAPIFDHSKIALIDEMVRAGVPAGNPFFGEAGAPERVAYYYLWHFGAAELALLLGMIGWEADAALTWFTAFASLSLMMGLATWLAGRASAAWWALLLAATASLRPLISLVLGTETAYALIGWSTGFGGWLFQSSWAPQHVAGALCCILAILLMAELARRRSVLRLLVLGLVVAAGFQSSAWVGGIVFPAAAAVAGLVLLVQVPPNERIAWVLALIGAAVLAGILAALFLHDQSVATALRGNGSPIAFKHYEVLGTAVPESVRRILDYPAYWLIFLPIEFPAAYPAGMIAMVSFLGARRPTPDDRLVVTALASLVAVSLVVAWLLVSAIGYNNDLGWRAVLPATMLLVAFAAAGIAQWAAARRRIAVAAITAAVLAGLFDSILMVNGSLVFDPAPSAKIFARTPEMWAAVRRHAAPDDRIANNPMFLKDVTPWPVNISWALLANRRSCFASRELAVPFAPVSEARRDAIEAQFVRIFAGDPQAGDLELLATRYRCRVVVVTAQDGAWSRDPFAARSDYRLVESQPDAWRIYRIAGDVK